MKQTKKVAVMTVAFNRSYELDTCLNSIRKNKYPALFDIYIVDNASSENIRRVAKKHDTGYLKLDKNYFVSRALNTGFTHFKLAEKYDYVLLMGSDVMTDRHLIYNLTRTMDQDPTIAVCGPSHHQMHSNILQTIGLSISRLTSLLINTTAMWQNNPINHFHSLYMVRTDAFQKIDGYDSVLYPMIYEEPDLGERLLKKGYKLMPCTKAKIWHPIDQQKPKADSVKMRIPKERLYNSLPKAYLFFRNRIIYMSTYSNPIQFLLFYFIFNPAISLYYLSQLDSRYIKYALIGMWDGTIYAIAKKRTFITARNKALLAI